MEFVATIDDAIFLHSGTGDRTPAYTNELTERYGALLQALRDHPDAEPIQAAAECYRARLHELNRQTERALASYQESIDRWYSLVRRNPDTQIYRLALVRTLYCQESCRSLTSERLRSGIVHADVSTPLAFLTNSLSGGPLDSVIREEFVDLLFEKAEVLRQQGLEVAANQHLKSCLATCDSLVAIEPDSHGLRFRALMCQDRLAGLHSDENSRIGTYREREKVLQDLEDLVSHHPENDEYRLASARLAVWLASHGGKRYAAMPPERIDALFQSATTTLQALVADGEPKPEILREYARTLEKRASRALVFSDEVNAVYWAGECLQWMNRAESTEAVTQFGLAQTFRTMALLYRDCGEREEAMKSFEQAGKLYQSVCRDANRNRAVHLQHAEAWRSLALMQEELGDNSAAISSLQAAVSALERWRGANPTEPHMATELKKLRSQVTRLTTIHTE